MLAVVVAHRPGEWFRESLESLALQDYGPLSVAVVDAAGSGIGPRVAEVLADATVIDAAGASGFSEAANAVLSANLGADFLLVCHDDVALAGDAVSTLVVEALRSNAGMVGPKIVEWDRPEIIRHAGYDVDRFGVPADRAGAHELDQEQHDGVRDAFGTPDGQALTVDIPPGIEAEIVLERAVDRREMLVYRQSETPLDDEEALVAAGFVATDADVRTTVRCGSHDFGLRAAP